MPDLSGFHHVKLPVADLRRSRDWYTSVLGLRVEIEFVKDGVLRGLALTDAGGRLRLALRLDPYGRLPSPASTRSPSRCPNGMTSRPGGAGWTAWASPTAAS